VPVQKDSDLNYSSLRASAYLHGHCLHSTSLSTRRCKVSPGDSSLGNSGVRWLLSALTLCHVMFMVSRYLPAPCTTPLLHHHTWHSPLHFTPLCRVHYSTNASSLSVTLPSKFGRNSGKLVPGLHALTCCVSFHSDFLQFPTGISRKVN
jgi:hypothetical protein